MACDGQERLIEQVLAENLVRQRSRLGWTQEALGRHSGVSMYLIAHVERQARNPTLQTLDRLAAALQTTVQELLTQAAF